jgi:starch synthase
MEIALISPEITPYSRATDLGDTCAALAKTLRGLGHRVTVISPLWAGIDSSQRSLARKLTPIETTLEGQKRAHMVLDGRTTGGVDLVFLGEEQRLRELGHAGQGDDRTRALCALDFCAAAVELLAVREPHPDVVHAFSWFGAAALPLASERLGGVSTVFSPDPAGATKAPELAASLLSSLSLPDGLRSALGTGREASLSRAGFGSAARVIASSREHERLVPEEAHGKLSVIADGVDSARWNPATDALLPARFGSVDLEGKQQCKGALQLAVSLPGRPEVPLIVAVGDFDAEAAHPGTAAFREALAGILRNEAQVLVLGASGLRSALGELPAQYEDRLRLLDEQDERTLHRAIAGADFALLPMRSRVLGELCASAQRYGTLPIAPLEGSLADTLVDCDPTLTTGNAFTSDGSAAGLLSAAQRALSAFTQLDALDRLRQRVMRADSSWERAARRYEHAYKQLAK